MRSKGAQTRYEFACGKLERHPVLSNRQLTLENGVYIVRGYGINTEAFRTLRKARRYLNQSI